MLKVSVGDNTSRNTVICEASDTLRSVLEGNGVSTVGAIHLNGTPVSVSELDKSFDELGYHDPGPGVEPPRIFLIRSAKMDNA